MRDAGEKSKAETPYHPQGAPPRVREAQIQSKHVGINQIAPVIAPNGATGAIFRSLAPPPLIRKPTPVTRLVSFPGFLAPDGSNDLRDPSRKTRLDELVMVEFVMAGVSAI